MKIFEKKQQEEPDSAEFHVVDKRKFLDLDDGDKTTISDEKPRYPSYVEELMSRMKETERKFQEKKALMDQEIARTRARLESDFERKLGLEKQKFVLPFLEVLDNLQRAIEASTQTGSVEHLLEGVQMTANLFRSKLQSLGVDPIATFGQPFDPNLAQAVGAVLVKEAKLDGIVVEELQTGYSMEGQLLRPAQVRVGRLD
jgi:molecular chaperone GrpE